MAGASGIPLFAPAPRRRGACTGPRGLQAISSDSPYKKDGGYSQDRSKGPPRVCTIANFPTGAPILPGPSDSTAHKSARYILIGALLLLGGWMLQRFLPALSWAVVLAVATASLYDAWLKRFSGPRRRVWAALTFTAVVGII